MGGIQLLQTGTDRTVGQEIDFFFGKVDRRLDMDTRLDQGIEQGLDPPGKLAGQRALGGAGGGGAAGGDQVGHRFGLGQVEFAFQEGALGELAWPRRAGAELVEPGQQQVEQDRVAVAVQLDHVLAGVGRRRRKDQHQAPVDDLAILILEAAIERLARRQCGAGTQLAGDRPGLRPGQADDADAGLAMGGGDGGDGVACGHRCGHEQPARHGGIDTGLRIGPVARRCRPGPRFGGRPTSAARRRCAC